MDEKKNITIVVGTVGVSHNRTWYGLDVPECHIEERVALSEADAIGKLMIGRPQFLRGRAFKVRLGTVKEKPGYYASVDGIPGETFGSGDEAALGQLVIDNQKLFNLTIVRGELAPPEPDDTLWCGGNGPCTAH
jgi:hypothetical protein